jgi:SAM-dependent methyltransferase
MQARIILRTDHAGDLTMRDALKRWVLCSLVLGLALVLASILVPMQPTFPEYKRANVPPLLYSGVVMMVLAIAAWSKRDQLARWLDGLDTADERAAHGTYAYLTLFLISFVTLFVEIALIRYCSSQIRIFSFYKNVPLIGSFLGLGLGCWLGHGKPRHVVGFLAWMVPVALALSQGALLVDSGLGIVAAAGSSEHILGDAVIPNPDPRLEVLAQIFMGVFCVVTLVVVTSLFALLGRFLGDALQDVPRLPGYTVNIVGSLVGTLLFFACSYLQTPPWVWFICGLTPLLWWISRWRDRLVAATLIAIATLAVVPQQGETVWSPYQKLVGHRLMLTGRPGEPATPAYLVQISDMFYQMAADLRPEAVARYGRPLFPHYDRVYQSVSNVGRVLIVGAGTGNDVAAALRAGAEHVDAVDIDPGIVRIGFVEHPERPYADPRVRVIVDDARAAFRKLSPQSYDVVVFGLLDSVTQLSMSSVRLDNYVFTRESFDAAKNLLKPGGFIVVTAATFRDWFRDRLQRLIEASCDGDAIQTRDGPWTTYACRVSVPSNASAPERRAPDTTLPTDDWPFLHLRERGVPLAYVIVVGMLVVASVLTLRREGLSADRFTAYHGHLFFLGAAFLLMEVSAINRLALLFGTTWNVSAITIVCVLLLIVLANLTVRMLSAISYRVAYTALFFALAASFLVQPQAALGKGSLISLGYGLLCLSPVFFAGLVFARSFRDATDAGTALGANILGAVLGGWSEYATMLFGIRAMVVLAALFYFASLIMLLRARVRERVEPAFATSGVV